MDYKLSLFVGSGFWNCAISGENNTFAPLSMKNSQLNPSKEADNVRKQFLRLNYIFLCAQLPLLYLVGVVRCDICLSLHFLLFHRQSQAIAFPKRDIHPMQEFCFIWSSVNPTLRCIQNVVVTRSPPPAIISAARQQNQ
jgi:hypothetical protein